MNNKESVLSKDPTAQLMIWGDPSTSQGFWVKGNGWETKLTYSKDRAWELASTEVSK